MTTFICIIVTENNINKLKAIENTWLKNITENFKYFFFIDKSLITLFDIKESENYIYINNLNYDSHFSIIRYLNNFEYDFIMITYLNSYINIVNLQKLINTLDKNDEFYIGGHGDYRTVNNIKFYFHSYMPGIILSKNTCNSFLDLQLMENYSIVCTNDLKNLSGIAIAYYVNLFNIKCIINDNFYYCNWKGNPCHVYNNNIDDLICCSNMEINDMISFYNMLNEPYFLSSEKTQNSLENNMHIIICPGGGLGNILFQYFNSYVLSKKYNCKVSYQCNYNYWRGDMNKYKMFQHLDFIDFNSSDLTNYLDYNEKYYYYYDNKLERKNYKISGYWQSFKYSEKYIDDIKNELFFNIASIYYNIEQKYFNIKNNKKTCLIHVRRGDYLGLSNVHPTCNDAYYQEAIKLIPNCKYLIFSDDIQFISKWQVLDKLDYEIVDLTEPEEVLILMSLCDNFIIANSTLSLCAYLLRNNKNAKLVAPKNWFGATSYKYKIEDIIPPEGILI